MRNFRAIQGFLPAHRPLYVLSHLPVPDLRQQSAGERLRQQLGERANELEKVYASSQPLEEKKLALESEQRVTMRLIRSGIEHALIPNFVTIGLDEAALLQDWARMCLYLEYNNDGRVRRITEIADRVIFSSETGLRAFSPLERTPQFIRHAIQIITLVVSDYVVPISEEPRNPVKIPSVEEQIRQLRGVEMRDSDFDFKDPEGLERFH